MDQAIDSLLRSAAVAARPLVIAGLLIGGIVIGVWIDDMPRPPEWLTGWTTWLLNALTIVFGPTLVVAAAKALFR